MLRCPDDSAAGRMVKNIVIPAILLLKSRFPLPLNVFLSTHVLVWVGQDKTAVSSKIDVFDQFLDSLKTNSFHLVPRCHDAWAPCYADSPPALSSSDLCALSPLSDLTSLPSSPSSPSASETPLTSTPPLSLKSLDLASCHVIQTNYDPDLLENKKPHVNIHHRVKNLEWTEKERTLAGCAEVPVSLQDLEHKLQEMHASGKKPVERPYIQVPMGLVDDTLTIHGQQGRLTACVSTAMPEAMRRDLLDRLISRFNSDPLRDVDSTSSAPEGQTTFQALHFSWYNRHSTKGHAAPTDVQPLFLTRLGRSRTNYGQFIPYASKDITDYAAVYQAVKNILHDVFDWLQEKLEGVLPIEYERLEATASVLPDYNISAVHLFIGLVLNFNIATC
ncbi:hypothetical protein C8Q72DRAFT_417787, partial [Fomitopsis betulina]